MSDTADFFRGRFVHAIDQRHPFAVLGPRMSWQETEARLAAQFARRVREGKRVEEEGLLEPRTQRLGGGVSKACRPRLPTSGRSSDATRSSFDPAFEPTLRITPRLMVPYASVRVR